jgi:hypothetical protein
MPDVEVAVGFRRKPSLDDRIAELPGLDVGDEDFADEIRRSGGRF